MKRGMWILILALGSAMLIVGCLGDRGPIGPEGDTGAQGSQGPPGDDGEPGPPGLVWRGDWSSSTYYHVDDAIQRLGSSYVCKQYHSNHAPPHATYWDMLAEKGEDGSGGTWNGGNVSNPTTFQDFVNFADGADFNPGTNVDFSNANVTGLNVDAWDGGTVQNAATFNSHVTFQDGTTGVTWENGHIQPGANIDVGYSGGVYTISASGGGGSSCVCNDDDFEQYSGGQQIAELSNGNWGELHLWPTNGYGNGEVVLEASDEPAMRLFDENGNERVTAIAETGSPEVTINDTSGDWRAKLWEQGGCGRLSLKNSSGSTTISFNGCSPLIQLKNSRGEVTIELDGESGNVYFSGELVKK